MIKRPLVSVATHFLINGAVWASYVPRLPEIRDRIGLNLAELGLAMTLGMVGGLIGSTVCGRLNERFGTRRVMMVASLGLIWSLPVIAIAPSFIILTLTMGVLHFFDVLTDVAMNLQGSWLSSQRTKPVMNRLHGLWSLGTLGAGIIAAQLTRWNVPIVQHLLATSVVLTVGVVIVAPGLLTRDRPAGAASRFGVSRAGFVLAVLGFAALVIELIPSEWAAIQLVDDLGVDLATGGLGYVAFTAGMFSGRFTGDSITARIGPDRFVAMATATGIIGLVTAGLGGSLAVSLVGYLLAGLGAAAIFPRLYDIAANRPGRPGSALGMMTAGSRIGGLASPIAVGVLAESAFTVGASMAIVTVPSAAVILLYSIRRIRNQ